MDTFFIVLLWSGAALALLCSLRWPRTIFGGMLLLGVGFFIAFNFALESKNWHALLAVGVVGVASYVAILGRAVVRFQQGAEARVWRGAGFSFGRRLWLGVVVSGKEASNFWLMQIVCAAAIAAALTGSLCLKLL